METASALESDETSTPPTLSVCMIVRDEAQVHDLLCNIPVSLRPPFVCNHKYSKVAFFFPKG